MPRKKPSQPKPTTPAQLRRFLREWADKLELENPYPRPPKDVLGRYPEQDEFEVENPPEWWPVDERTGKPEPGSVAMYRFEQEFRQVHVALLVLLHHASQRPEPSAEETFIVDWSKTGFADVCAQLETVCHSECLGILNAQWNVWKTQRLSAGAEVCTKALRKLNLSHFTRRRVFRIVGEAFPLPDACHQAYVDAAADMVVGLLDLPSMVSTEDTPSVVFSHSCSGRLAPTVFQRIGSVGTGWSQSVFLPHAIRAFHYWLVSGGESVQKDTSILLQCVLRILPTEAAYLVADLRLAGLEGWRHDMGMWYDAQLAPDIANRQRLLLHPVGLIESIGRMAPHGRAVIVLDTLSGYDLSWYEHGPIGLVPEKSDIHWSPWRRKQLYDFCKPLVDNDWLDAVVQTGDAHILLIDRAKPTQRQGKIYFLVGEGTHLPVDSAARASQPLDAASVRKRLHEFTEEPGRAAIVSQQLLAEHDYDITCSPSGWAVLGRYVRDGWRSLCSIASGFRGSLPQFYHDDDMYWPYWNWMDGGLTAHRHNEEMIDYNDYTFSVSDGLKVAYIDDTMVSDSPVPYELNCDALSGKESAGGRCGLVIDKPTVLEIFGPRVSGAVVCDPQRWGLDAMCVDRLHCVAYEPDVERIRPEYLAYCMLTYRREIKAQRDVLPGTADGDYLWEYNDPERYPDLEPAFFAGRRVRIPVPSLEEQDRILADYLEELVERERERYEKRVKRIHQEFSEYEIVGTLAHNILNKVTPIVNPLRRLQRYLERRGLVDDPVQERRAPDQRIDTAGQTLHGALSHLELMSGAARAARDMARRRIDAAHFEEREVLSLLLEKIVSDGTYVLEINGQPARVRMHPEAFVEAVHNIVRNAREHAFTPGDDNRMTITVTPDVEPGFVDIRCVNNGKPFPREITPHDFMLLGRKSKDSKGSGIGGAWVGRVLKAHGGRLFISYPEIGADLILRLPLANQQSHPPSPTEE